MRARVPAHAANELRAAMEAQLRHRVETELLEETLPVLHEEGEAAFDAAWQRGLDRIVAEVDVEFLERLRQLEVVTEAR